MASRKKDSYEGKDKDEKEKALIQAFEQSKPRAENVF